MKTQKTFLTLFLGSVLSANLAFAQTAPNAPATAAPPRPIPNQNQTVPNQNQTIPNQNQTVPNQNQTIPNQNQTIPNQGGILPGDQRRLPPRSGGNLSNAVPKVNGPLNPQNQGGQVMPPNQGGQATPNPGGILPGDQRRLPPRSSGNLSDAPKPGVTNANRF